MKSNAFTKVLNCDRDRDCGCIAFFYYCGQLRENMTDTTAIMVAKRFRRLSKLTRRGLDFGFEPIFETLAFTSSV